MVCHPGVTDCQVCDRQSKGFESDENPANTDPVTRYITCRQVVGVSRHDLFTRYIYLISMCLLCTVICVYLMCGMPTSLTHECVNNMHVRIAH